MRAPIPKPQKRACLSVLGFHIMIPDFRDEILHVMLSAPCSLDDALCAFAEARDSTASLHLDVLIPAHPQPDPSFACVLALPSWDYTRQLRRPRIFVRLMGGLFSYAFPCTPQSIIHPAATWGCRIAQVYRCMLRINSWSHSHCMSCSLGSQSTVLPSGLLTSGQATALK